MRDRWIWLALGIILFLISWIVGATAQAAVDTAAAATPTDPLIEMAKTSGPAGGMVLILGYFIRTWQADVKAQNLKTDASLEKLRDLIEQAHRTDSTISSMIAVLRAEQAAIVQRVDRLERRSSGTHRRSEE